MRVDFSKRFLKDLKKIHKKTGAAFADRLELFIENKFHPLLNNHPLAGQYAGCRSINVSGDIRAIFEELANGEVIYFITIGTHSQLYG